MISKYWWKSKKKDENLKNIDDFRHDYVGKKLEYMLEKMYPEYMYAIQYIYMYILI